MILEVKLIVKGSLDLFEDIFSVFFDELHEDLRLELFDNSSFIIISQLVLSSRLINLLLMTLEISHEKINANFTGLLLAFELLDAAMSDRFFFLLAKFADQEKGLTIISPMLLDFSLVAENPLDLLEIIANMGDTAGFPSTIVFFILLSTVLLALSFHLIFIARQPLRFIDRFLTLPHALCLVVDGASIFSFTKGALSMVGSLLVVFLECATDVFGKVFILLDWALLRHTLRVRAAIMYLSIVFYRNNQVRSHII